MASGVNAKGKMVITDLDFDQIKTNLKTYLQSQKEFTDYDFTGSGLSILLDLLAYNTHYNAFMANMLANEMFLDSAVKRASIGSHAKALGYTPTGVRAPTAYLNILVSDATGASITMNIGHAFTSTVSGNNYQFVNTSERILTPTAGVFTFANIPVYEGTWTTSRFTVNTEDVDQKFIIPNVNVDITTLQISIQTSTTDTTLVTYTKANNIVEVKPTTTAFFIQETLDDQWQIYFGDGVVGKSLVNGNIVIAKYVITNGPDANAATLFQSASNISGFSDITVTTASAASGGATAETDKSIKFNAPFSYAAQNRAVTAQDYRVIIPQLYSNISSISVWGGEYASPAVYGKVYISIIPKTGSTLTTSTKTEIVNLLDSYNVASITPVIVDAETTKIIPTITFKYDSSSTTKTKEDLASEITTKITSYSNDTLEKFESLFRHSVFTTMIDDVNPAILSNITNIKMSKTFTPTLATDTKYTISFSNALYHPHSGHMASQTGTTPNGILTSSGFTQTGKTPTYYLDDDGAGLVWIYYISASEKVYESASVGTINYTTGEVVLTKLDIATIGDVDSLTSTIIRLTVTPASDDVVPVRNQVLAIDTTNLSVTGTADTIASGVSDGGTNYTTTASY